MQIVYQIQQQTAGSCIAKIFVGFVVYIDIDIGVYIFTHIEYGKCIVFGVHVETERVRERERDSGTEKKRKEIS